MKKRAFKSVFTEMAMLPVSLYKRLMDKLDDEERREINDLNKQEGFEEDDDVHTIDQQDSDPSTGTKGDDSPTVVVSSDNDGTDETGPQTEEPSISSGELQSDTTPLLPPPVQTEAVVTDKVGQQTEDEQNEEQPAVDAKFPSLRMKVFPCDICGQAFASKFSLKRHVNAMHGSRSKVQGGKKRGRKPSVPGYKDLDDEYDTPAKTAKVQGQKRKAKVMQEGVKDLKDFTEPKALNQKSGKLAKTDFAEWL